METASQRSMAAVILVLITFLAISIITNILGPLLPLIKQDFNINNTVAGFFPLFFFIFETDIVCDHIIIYKVL